MVMELGWCELLGSLARGACLVCVQGLRDNLVCEELGMEIYHRTVNVTDEHNSFNSVLHAAVVARFTLGPDRF